MENLKVYNGKLERFNLYLLYLIFNFNVKRFVLKPDENDSFPHQSKRGVF